MAIFKYKYKKYSDEQLMELLQYHDTTAFNVLYERYSKKLLLFFYRLLHDEQKAQDFLQDTFLKIVENPKRFCTDKKFSTWIFVVAYNLCKNEYRYKNVRKNVENVDDLDVIVGKTETDYHYVEKNVDHDIFKAALYQELENIGVDHRITFILRHQQNYSIKEISEIMNCSEGTVKSRLFYTVKKLAHNLRAFNPY